MPVEIKLPMGEVTEVQTMHLSELILKQPQQKMHFSKLMGFPSQEIQTL